jgi:surfactin synthase thioesterase subunit
VSSLADEWFVTRTPRPSAPVQLWCFPYAGAGAGAYAAWPAVLGIDVEVSALMLPGRERRYREPAVIVPQLIAKVVADRVDRPYALFGHSMGARLAFEVIRELIAAGGPLPCHLFVSGSPSPDEPRRTDGPYDDLSTVDDDEMVARLVAGGGIPPEILAEPELVALMLPTFRGDFTWLDAYVYRPAPPMPVPVTAFAAADDPAAPPDRVAGWKRLATGSFVQHTVPGGHFFVIDRLDEVAALIRRALRDSGAASPPDAWEEDRRAR